MSLGAEWYAQIPHAATFWSFGGLLSVQCLRLCLCPPVVVKFLLHKKCDTRVVNNWGKTGLDYATERHHDHVVRVLEMQGAPRGEVRVKTPPKVESRELGRVAERTHWIQQLLSRHAADPDVDTPCQHEGVVAEVLAANRNRGFVADNHYDISAAAKALAAATSSPAFCLPELLPSVILWRALTYCVTHASRCISTVGVQDTCGGIQLTADKQMAETVDQEWRKVSMLRAAARCPRQQACRSSTFTQL
jgi:hypothetical protein